MSKHWLIGFIFIVILSGFKAQAATYAFQSAAYKWETTNTNIVWDQTQTDFARDDDKRVINIGFTFNFAGVNYTQVRVHSNGVLQFGADTQFHRQFANTDLPVTIAPPTCSGCANGTQADKLMLIYWDDIDPRLGGTVRYQTKGVAPNRKLVVSWEAVPHYNLDGTYTFQVILSESGEFVYQYGAGNASGVSATIGVEVDNTDFTLYSFNSSYGYAGTAIRWFKPSGVPARLAEYRLEEAQLNGTVNEVLDWSGNNFNGEAVGAAAAEASGYICRGASIPSNTDSAVSAINTNLDVDATIGTSGALAFWYRGNSAWNTRDNQLLDATSQNGLWFFLVKRANQNLRFVIADSAGVVVAAETTAQAVPANTWKHIAVTWRMVAGTNQTVLRIYVGGVLAAVTQATTSGVFPSSLSTLYVGDNRSDFIGQNGTANSADGRFDEVHVYNYEISNADVLLDLAATHPCVVLDHIRITHDGAGLTCNPETVTLQACANAVCSSFYAGSVSATLRATAATGTTTQAVSFTNGAGNVSFRYNVAGAVALDVISASPAAAQLSQCTTTGTSPTSCVVNFASSGFIFDVPNLLAAKPQAAIVLRAVKQGDSSQTCVPGFTDGGLRKLQFSSTYLNPATGTKPVLVNGKSVTASATDVDLTFDDEAAAKLTVQYDDAGQMQLNASYTPSSGVDSGLVMTGSDTFVARPYGLLLQTDTSSSCTVADVSCPLYSSSVRAGDAFNLKIKAVGWQSDGEALTAAALADNLVTPNFQLNNIALSSQLLAPVVGSNSVLGVGSYSHLLGTVANSNTTTVSQTISEVGVFSLTATPPVNGYFGETVSASVSGLVGRFAPAYLTASGSASLTPACGSSFSYQGQPMAFAVGQEPALTVTGYNRAGGVTSNYDRGAFWRLATPTRNAYVSVTGKASLDASGRLTSAGSASLSQSGADNGDGAQSYRWSGETLTYTPATLPLAADLPFTAAVSQGVSAAALTDADSACYLNGQASCQAYTYNFAASPGTAVRLGRLRIGNAHGSELQALSLPITLESWQSTAGGSFQPEGLDTCTNAAVLGAPLLSVFTGNLTTGETTPSLVWPVVGSRSLLLSAPGAGNDGSVQETLTTLPTWLYFDWNGSGRSAAKGLASFGIYAGSKPLIFRRELYR
jgi:hypothetical protein